MLKRTISLILAAILSLSGAAAVHSAVSCDPKIEEYTVKDNVGMETNRIEMGDAVSLSIDIKDSLLRTSDISSADNIEIISVDGSFGSPKTESINITSEGSSPLEYTAEFKDIAYSGSGTGMSFKVRYKNIGLVSDRIYLSIDECSENDISDDTPSENDDSQPHIEIVRSSIENPIKSGEKFNVTLTVKNRGTSELKHPSVTISLPDSIIPLEGMGNISIPDIKAGGSANVTLRLQAADYITYASEEIDINLSYSYKTSMGLTESGYSDRIFIPMEANSKNNAPLAQITRESLPSPIAPDTEFVLPVVIKNTGASVMSSPVITFTLPKELILLDDNVSQSLENIEPDEERKISLRLKTEKYISSPTLEINTELKYGYTNAGQPERGSEETALIIPVSANDTEGAEPLVFISADSPKSPLSAGSAFSVNLKIENLSDTPLKAAVMTFDAADGIILTQGSASQNVGELKGGESRSLVLSGRLSENITTSVFNVTGELKYKYETGKQQGQGSESVKIVLPANPSSSSSKSSTPNIIVRSYNYGGVPIAAGDDFGFDVTFENTSRTKSVDNIVMTIETGEGVLIRSASNTYYYDGLGAGASRGESVDMQVLPSAEKSSVTLSISFKYEYVDNGERTPVTTEQTVSIPCYKPDKLEVVLDPLPAAQPGIEQNVGLSYVNKGQGSLSNVKAEIVGDVNALTPVQNLGNFEPGKSGNIYFVVIPDAPGELEFTIKLTYEDPNMDEKVLEFPCVMTVEEAVEEYPITDEELMSEEEGSSHKLPIIIAVAVIAAAAAAAFIIIRKRKKKKAANAISVNWEAEDEDKGSL